MNWRTAAVWHWVQCLRFDVAHVSLPEVIRCWNGGELSEPWKTVHKGFPKDSVPRPRKSPWVRKGVRFRPVTGTSRSFGVSVSGRSRLGLHDAAIQSR